MRQTRTSSTESGVVEVGGAWMVNFMTTWGDGLFDVYRDVDAKGALVRVRIEFGTEKRVQLMRSLTQRAESDEGAEYCAAPDTFSLVTVGELRARESGVEGLIDSLAS